MLKIGSHNELVVERKVDFGFYLNPKPDKDQIFEPLGVGDRRKAYINQIRDDGKIEIKPNGIHLKKEG